MQLTGQMTWGATEYGVLRREYIYNFLSQFNKKRTFEVPSDGIECHWLPGHSNFQGSEYGRNHAEQQGIATR